MKFKQERGRSGWWGRDVRCMAHFFTIYLRYKHALCHLRGLRCDRHQGPIHGLHRRLGLGKGRVAHALYPAVWIHIFVKAPIRRSWIESIHFYRALSLLLSSFLHCLGLLPLKAPYSNTNQHSVRTFSKGIWKSVYLTSVSSAAITHVVPHTFYNGSYPVGPLQPHRHGDFQVQVGGIYLHTFICCHRLFFFIQLCILCYFLQIYIYIYIYLLMYM